MGDSTASDIRRQISKLSVRLTRAVRRALRSGDWDSVERLVWESLVQCSTMDVSKSRSDNLSKLLKMVREKKEEERPKRKKGGVVEELFKPMTRKPVDGDGGEQEAQSVQTEGESPGLTPEVQPEQV